MTVKVFYSFSLRTAIIHQLLLIKENYNTSNFTEMNVSIYRCVYGGFTSEAYEELVRYHRSKEIPKRLQGHLKHRIDCFKRKAKRFQLIEGTDQLIYIGK